MIIKELLTQLETSDKPIAKSIRKGESFNLISIGFKKDMILKEHMTTIPAKLIVVKGCVVYKEIDFSSTLHEYDTYDIPVNIKHSVVALEDSLCFLIKG